MKKTQGQYKAAERVRELLNNDEFKKEVERITNMKDADKKHNELFLLAQRLNLDFSVMSPFFEYIKGRRKKLYGDLFLDVCQIFDEVDEYLNEYFPLDYNTPPSQDPNKRLRINLYPVHIGISPNATQRDVLDFITKRWSMIRTMLDVYEKKPVIPRKKRKHKRNAFIEKNINIPSKELAEKVNNKYPEENLTYDDINSIKSYIKKRRSRLN